MRKNLLFLFMLISLIDATDTAAQDCGLTTPTLTCPQSINVTTCDLSGAYVQYTLPQSSCGTPELDSGLVSGSLFPPGTTIVTYRVRYQIVFLFFTTPIFLTTYKYCSFAVTVTVIPSEAWVLDSDNDGYYVGDPVQHCGSPGPGYKILTTQQPDDCDDTSPDMHGLFDFWVDADGDGFGNSKSRPVKLCAPNGGTPPAGYAINGDDCNDTDPNLHQLFDFWVDADGDGFGNSKSKPVKFCAPDENTPPVGYAANGTDCNDKNGAIHPGATEVCDGIDNDCDCDGSIDEGLKLVFYRDADGDGYGNAAVSVQDCTAPIGYVTNNTDCNDNPATGGAAINPATVWIRDKDQDGYYYISAMQCSSPGLGYIIKTTQLPEDCNDNDPTINPGAVEVCNNGKDDNCNGIQNEAGCYSCQNATSFSTTNITSNSATLNWVSIPHPDYWQIQYKTSPNGSQWIDVTPDPAGNRRSVTINGLTPNKNYQWHIKAKCGNGWTTYSISILFTTAGGVTARSETNTKAEMEVSEVAIESLQVKATPNPSNTSFRITLNSNNLKEPVKLIITDMLGRVIETRTTNAGQIIIGKKYRSGTYLVRIIQGEETRQLKLIKLPD